MVEAQIEITITRNVTITHVWEGWVPMSLAENGNDDDVRTFIKDKTDGVEEALLCGEEEVIHEEDEAFFMGLVD